MQKEINHFHLFNLRKLKHSKKQNMPIKAQNRTNNMHPLCSIGRPQSSSSKRRQQNRKKNLTFAFSIVVSIHYTEYMELFVLQSERFEGHLHRHGITHSVIFIEQEAYLLQALYRDMKELLQGDRVFRMAESIHIIKKSFLCASQLHLQPHFEPKQHKIVKLFFHL